MNVRLEELGRRARELPSEPGVYLMKDANRRLLYVGKAVSLRQRVANYFQPGARHATKNAALVDKIADFEVIPCDSEVDALLREARLIKDLQPPYNILLKDGKSFPYIEITGDDDFPLVRVTRERHVSTSRYWGPFTSAGSLRPALDLLQNIFRFRTCEMSIIEGHPAQKYTRPCLLHQIGRCTAPCAGRVTAQSYARDMEGLIQLLEGETATLRQNFQNRMEQAAAHFDYEEAALVRDRLKALAGLRTAGPLGSQPEMEIAPVDPASALEELGNLLKLEFTPRSIEGFDVAHLGGKQTVASMVAFVDGRPFKEGYRHFRIHSTSSGDDYAALTEVLNRRYGRLLQEGQPLPHIILIDGGRGQLNTALGVFRKLGRPQQLIVSLAKKQEKIFVPWRHRAIVLSRYESALRCLQHVRDEAHRFAQRYHHLLRDRSLTENL